MAGKNTVARLLGQHKAAILRDLDVNRVLPRLIKNEVITQSEERQIIESGGRKVQCEVFLDILSKKGVGAFHEFCASLEESSPHLLTGFLLENPEAISDEKGPTKALQLGFELALKERDHALRQLQQVKTERDSALASLDNIEGKNKTPSKSSDSNQENRSKSPSRKPRSKSMESDTEIDEGLRRSSSVKKNKSGDTVVWETHKVSLTRVPGFGFGIAVSGGVDNPHFANGDPSIAISDVLKAGPAEGKLLINDRVVSVNSCSLENVDHRTAIQVLKDSGNKVHLVIRRRVVVPSMMDPETPLKIMLEKRNRKDDFGVVLGCKFFIKEIYSGSLAREEGTLQEGDTVLKINNTPVDNLSVHEARKLIEKTKEKLQLFVTKKNLENRRATNRLQDDEASLGYGTLQGTLQTQKSEVDSVNIYRPNGPIDEVYKQDIPRGAYPPSEHARYDGRYIYDHEGPPVPPLPTGVDPNAPPRPPSPGKEALRSDDFYNSPQQNDGYYSDRPESHMDKAPTRRHHHDERYVGKRNDIISDPRFVFFHKQPDLGLGLRLAGGNATGIFIASVQPGSGAADVGLTEGDEILMANNREIHGLSREEAVTYLTSLEGQVQMQVHYKKEEYDRIMASKEAGDSFYVRAHFSLETTEQGELSINHGDIFLVKDTLFRGSVGSWLAVSLGKNNKENKKGIIPNRTRADEIMGTQQTSEADKENSPAKVGRGLFKRKTARRSKSLGKDHWEDVIFSDDGANLTTKFPAYEKVLISDVNFVRPVVIFGALSDVAREKMLMEYPDRFESPQQDNHGLEDEKKTRSGIIRLGAIKEIINKRKHCLLDVTPNNVDKLNYAQYYPIVIFLKAESKNVVKESRSRLAKGSSKNPKKLYEQSLKLEKMYSHLFTGAVVQNNTDIWFRRVLEVIEVQQKQQIWMSEGQPEDNVHDDYLFPMNSRLSFAGPRESEQDLTRHRDEFEFSPKHRPRLVRSSSDPSVNTMEKIPGIPPYPAPPSYRKPSSPTSPGGGMYDDRRYVDLDQSEDRYYPSYYANNMSPRHPSRSHIDAYATITPHERLRPSLPTDERWFDPAYDLKSAPDHRRTDSDPAHRSYHNSHPHIPNDSKPFHDNASFSGDSYTRYTSHPANKHDDSKLREKFGTKSVRNTSHDPYRFTRSTAHPVNTASVDKSKLSDLTARYRKDEPNQKPRSLSTSRLPTSPQSQPSYNDQPQKKVPPPVPVKTYNLKERGIEPDELKMRNYENTSRGGSQDANDSDDRGSAFEAYRKPQLSTFGKSDSPHSPVVSSNGPMKNYSSEPISSGEGTTTTNQNALQPPVESCDKAETPLLENEPQSETVISGFKNDHQLDENHTVVATARGSFDHQGGVLESPETGVSIVIPAGAIPEGVQQEIYFKVCRDNNILPPLDKEKGETLLSPLVMCGPHGLKFLLPVELQLPHCASVNPESWSFALKSSDSPSGQPTQWQNMNLAGTEGVTQGRVGKSKVSVLVDHF
ncbi:tight junction protein ZO-1-like isoform X11 [Mytilus californianus]|uniref:tight junction protein ZO-1-like isoform X11 n=1 Tax=Mytilus californianus TaxID=6549 RepID=UPI0022464BCB|nr:tight junction protein ZO-1-like isoform X11 [Mytilus californianus]